MKFRKLGDKVFYLAMAMLLFLSIGESVSYAQTNDFFSSTSTSNARFKNTGDLSAGSTDCLSCPGFNPCNGSTLGGSSCNGNGLLRPTIVVSGVVTQVGTVGDQACISLCSGDPKFRIMASPFFSTTGPGAVTDNMLGAVSDPTQTALEVAAGTIPFGRGSRVPGQCGNTLGDGTFDPTIDPGVTSGLNCGYLRYDPSMQGMAVPSGPNTLLGQMVRTVDSIFTSQQTPANDCVLGTTIPRPANTGSNCDMIDFNAPPRAFTSIAFNFSNPATLVSIPKGFFNEFTYSGSVVCNPVTFDKTCARQSLVQETQTENGISHAEWAFIWSGTNSSTDGSSSSGAATCGNPINGVAQTTGGKVCVHWYSEYEDSPCHLVGTFDPSDCRGVASGYGLLDMTEGFFVYNADGAFSTPTSYPLGPQSSFGTVGASTP